MKKIHFAFIIISYLIISLSGCVCEIPPETKKEKTETKKEEPKEPGVIDYMTGREHIRVYKRTKSKLDAINKKLEERYQDE